MLLLPLYLQNREDRKSPQTSTAPVKPAAMIQERASGKRSQADHSRRKSLMSSSSQEPRSSEKPAVKQSRGVGPIRQSTSQTLTTTTCQCIPKLSWRRDHVVASRRNMLSFNWSGVIAILPFSCSFENSCSRL